MSPDRYGDRFEGYPPDLRYNIETRMYRAYSDASYRLVDGRVSTIRTGFEFKRRNAFASVPWILQPIRPTDGTEKQRYDIAALWHDWLYAKGTIEGKPITRKQADLVFLEIMAYVGCSWWVQRSMYRGVRIGAWLAWNRHRQVEQP